MLTLHLNDFCLFLYNKGIIKHFVIFHNNSSEVSNIASFKIPISIRKNIQKLWTKTKIVINI